VSRKGNLFAMFDALWQALGLVFQPVAFAYLMVGVALGIWIGAVPGLGAILGLVLLLPFTYGMDVISAFALLIGMWSVTTTSDTIASVMLGVPGTAASQATILDGYPLAKKGEASRALGAAFTVSAVGGILGAAILVISIPLVLPIILSFNSPELFVLGLLALTLVGAVSGSSVLKGLTVALFGLLLGTIGMAETAAIPRYTFGSLYLMDELPLIPVVLGLFAIPELMELATKNVSISRVEQQDSRSGVLKGIKDACIHWWLALKCGVIGTFIGMLPGLGGSIVDWVAYGYVVHSSKDKSKFGKGDIRGVIAPEAANNALKGGSLFPTLAIGIPGSVGAAILLDALMVHGLRPGPLMLTRDLHITLSLVWMIAIANVVAALVLMALSKQVAKIAFISGHLIVPGVVMLVFMGAWLGGSSMGDWVTVLVMGFIGYVMKSGGWPRPPLILALILCNILENAFQLSNQAYEGGMWLTRPIVLVLLVLTALMLYFSIRSMKKIRHEKIELFQDSELDQAGEGSERNPAVSLPFSILMVAVFLYAGIQSLSWPTQVMQFPIAIVIPGVFLSLIVIKTDWRDFIDLRDMLGNAAATFQHGARQALAIPSARYFGYLIAILVGSFVIGQKITLPIFVLLYLRRWGGFGWRTSSVYALVSWLILVLFYDWGMSLLFHTSWLQRLLQPVLPEFVPQWLIF
jgi:putative tricarboxylic transport membrane protein